MKDILRYTLLADGTSDEVLLPIIDWVIGQHLPDVRTMGAFARNFGKIGNDLEVRVKAAIQNFPCDLLVIHRDAENKSREDRAGEIAAAVQGLEVRHVCLIPIRMTEAWLFSDESAIRFAAGNATGNKNISVPKRDKWESLPDPKQKLLETLRLASGKSGRALDKFNPLKARHLITPRSASFEALRGISAFDRFEDELSESLRKIVHVVD